MTSGVTQKLQIDLRYEVKALSETFWQVSAKLARAAKEMHDPGIPPSEELLAEVTAAQNDFVALRAQLLGLARIVESTPVPDPNAVVSLRDLASVLQSAQESRKKTKMDEAKQQVLQKLDRVQSLAHREKAEFAPLIDCQARAAQLKLAIAPVDWANPTLDLVEGFLPFVDLLRMVEQLDQLDDEACERLQDSVAGAFGKLLAVAVSRGRVVLREAAPGPAVWPTSEAAMPPAKTAPETSETAPAEMVPNPKGAAPETAPDGARETLAARELSPAPATSAGDASEPAIAPAEADLAEVPPPDVHELVKLATELYKLLGHEVQKTVARADHEVDLTIRSADGKKWLARCRSQASPVNEAEVRTFYGVLQQEKAVQGAIITLGVFTPQARQWAKSNLLYLLDQEEFFEYLKRARSRK
jgi:hypothetical protein